MNPMDGMKGLARNPLGILAIFLGVLYGIAGLLLAVNGKQLNDINQTLVTILVVSFPFVSLACFVWLVSKHHTKLYAPLDYRSDQAFHGQIKSQSNADAIVDMIPEAISKSNTAEISASELSLLDNVSFDLGLPDGKWRSAVGSYVATSIAIDELGKKYQAGFRRFITLTLGEGAKISFSASLTRPTGRVFVQVFSMVEFSTTLERVTQFVEKLAGMQDEFSSTFPGSKIHLVTVARKKDDLKVYATEIEELKAFCVDKLTVFDYVADFHELGDLLIQRKFIKPPIGK